MTERIKTAVIGVGHQGRWHADKFAVLPGSELVAVVDIDRDRCQAVAKDLGAQALTDVSDLIGEVAAVSIATPTQTHFDIASVLLQHGIHVLLEKPIAASVDEARRLVELAESRDLVLQVGHLERFNPAVVALAGHVRQPLFIESNRIAPYKPRGLDVSVVLDLMIHDIDLIHSFVRSPMTHVDAIGRSIFSKSIDVANARIRFVNGCVANVTSSRISLKTERSLRIFQADSYVSADMHNKTFTHYSNKTGGPVTGPEDVAIDKRAFESADALLEQGRAFLESVAGGPPPLVSGRTALEALETATVIAEIVGESQQT
ncbi:MAG: Gfo/Idh/MocA family oxidoreductase [Gammaproteobacteria bacterium]|nr:Gfo/Idh/MocA family oxidoreductase [Gammaproteobacteria bacterium]